ncbi:uncharacterized protein F4807DRAFT_468908 [Annulohypoxylon truncatum]|uniref:uncharacterized protein n=1 Tax=Annulohypoxylon truncatum TaxID=327061 RepID=UPI002008AF2F|nr:uncharacterized protein F4807DRAFT_468908 [Annulohypoxylon truncatum]KAI1208031.1 hypothetical protein F4807DRAFT_468908 [Annulohypoxylon truncatum]
MASKTDTGRMYSRHLDDEENPFLANEEETINQAAEHTTAKWVAATDSGARSCAWLIHGIFFLFYTSIFLAFFIAESRKPCSNVSLLWSPAQDIVEWETRIIDAIPGSTPYTGYPNSVSDAAWADLLKGISLKILPEEMERLGYTSLALKDGSGFVGSLGVYHELHCIKRVRKMIYWNYYYPNMTTDEWHHQMGHIEHCLEQIRQSAICHGDVNVIPFSWLQDDEHQIPLPTMQFGSLHQCIKWDKLDAWAKERRLDLFDKELLVPANSK